MAKKVGICAVAQTTFERNKKDIRFQGMAMDVIDALREQVDVTLPARNSQRGGLHPLTILRDDICDLFIGLGYEVAEGPELESERLNFDALNIPADHPAAGSTWA